MFLRPRARRQRVPVQRRADLLGTRNGGLFGIVHMQPGIRRGELQCLCFGIGRLSQLPILRGSHDLQRSWRLRCERRLRVRPGLRRPQLRCLRSESLWISNLRLLFGRHDLQRSWGLRPDGRVLVRSGLHRSELRYADCQLHAEPVLERRDLHCESRQSQLFVSGRIRWRELRAERDDHAARRVHPARSRESGAAYRGLRL